LHLPAHRLRQLLIAAGALGHLGADADDRPAIGRAHRRLMEKLAPDAPYRRTIHPSLWSVVRQIVSDARAGAGVPGARPA